MSRAPGLTKYDANGLIYSPTGVPSTRTLNTTNPITGGGDLSNDRTLAIDVSTLTDLGAGNAAVADLLLWQLSGGGLRKARFDDHLYGVHGLTAKTTLAANDEFLLLDSAASNVAKKITKANLATALGAGGTPAFVGCLAYKYAEQSISTTAETAITFDSNSYDTNSIHSTSSNTSRFVVPTGKDGYWDFEITISAGNVNDRLHVVVYKNGTLATEFVSDGRGFDIFSITSARTETFKWSANLAASDYLEWKCYCNTSSYYIGGTNGANVGLMTSCEFSMRGT